ncbi:MAG TPA: hypothetical protein DIT28_20480 [Oxalobacteraceae bacterium]|jgi:hypothetical protein|nr:hypothetical protein [Oxalobacteraceae bacterium]HCN91523.1 hypothetical protein [Oxalobacteraceae bacterium]
MFFLHTRALCKVGIDTDLLNAKAFGGFGFVAGAQAAHDFQLPVRIGGEDGRRDAAPNVKSVCLAAAKEVC